MTRLVVFLCLIGFLTACSSQPENAAPIILTRYDQELQTFLHSNNSVEEQTFLSRHSAFYSLYTAEILQLPQKDSALKSCLIQKFSLPYMQQLQQGVDSGFVNVKDIERQLTHAFDKYRSLMPDDSLPRQIYTHTSGLQQQIVNFDTILAVSLDHYLGAQFPLYRSIFNPYQLQRKSREYIVPDILRVILYTRHPLSTNTQPTLLQEMIYEGKILYSLQRLLPDIPVERLMGYSEEEWQWCRNNESNMWNRLIQSKDLYSTDRFLIGKYISPAPFTVPFTQQSPGQAARYIGWRIVSEYVKQSGVSLTDLWNDNDELSLLKTAKYKG